MKTSTKILIGFLAATVAAIVAAFIVLALR